MTASLDAAFRELIRDVVRDELRAALADHRGTPLLAASSDPYLSLANAARLADVAPGTVRAWIRAGRLPAKRAGRVFRIARSELEAFLVRCAGREPDAALVATARAVRRVA